MYNDIGTNLCAGAAVGTCGYEDVDTKTYIDWGVDYIKVDNCYYLWDNATFSDERRAKYTYAPNIRSITVRGHGMNLTLNAVKDGMLTGQGGVKNEENDYVSHIGTLDGMHGGVRLMGVVWSELKLIVIVPVGGE